MEISEAICEAIAMGGSLQRLCEEKTTWPSERTVWRWIETNPTFRQAYARARERQAERFADELVHLADSSKDANLGRLKIDTRKWIIAKLLPKKFGDHLTVDSIVTTIPGPDPVSEPQPKPLAVPGMTPAEIDKIAEIQAMARQRVEIIEAAERRIEELSDALADELGETKIAGLGDLRLSIRRRLDREIVAARQAEAVSAGRAPLNLTPEFWGMTPGEITAIMVMRVAIQERSAVRRDAGTKAKVIEGRALITDDAGLALGPDDLDQPASDHAEPSRKARPKRLGVKLDG